MRGIKTLFRIIFTTLQTACEQARKAVLSDYPRPGKLRLHVVHLRSTVTGPEQTPVLLKLP